MYNICYDNSDDPDKAMYCVCSDDNEIVLIIKMIWMMIEMTRKSRRIIIFAIVAIKLFLGRSGPTGLTVD